MKIRISEAGYLEILRKNKWKTVACPFVVDFIEEFISDRNYRPYLKEYRREYRCCGDWCSQFSEPDYYSDIIELDTCHILYKIKKKNFEDLRED